MDSALVPELPPQTRESPFMELPRHSDGAASTQQPSSPCSTEQALPISFAPESSPGATVANEGRGGPEEPSWFLDATLPGGAIELAVEGTSTSVAALEETTTVEAPEQSVDWTGRSDEAPQTQAELAVESEGEDTTEGDRAQLQGLLSQLERLSPTFHDSSPNSEDGLLASSDGEEGHRLGGDRDSLHVESHTQNEFQGLLGEDGPWPLHIATGRGLGAASRWMLQPTRRRRDHGLLATEADQEDLLSLLHHEGGVPPQPQPQQPGAHSESAAPQPYQRAVESETAKSTSDPLEGSTHRSFGREESPPNLDPSGQHFSPELGLTVEPPPGADAANQADLSSFLSFKEVPGPCEPEDLLDGVIFGAKYLGSTQLISERNPPTSVRMAQAQEAVDRIKAPMGESQPMTEVDLFVSTQRVKVLTADSQKAMMDHPLQTISYIADIGNIVVFMARRKLPCQANASAEKQLYRMICHVFRSADAQLIAQAIGQAFNVAYQQFLHASGIDPSQIGPRRRGSDDSDSEAPSQSGELFNGDLAHFSKQENCKEVVICKQKGEILGVVVVESGWGSILPTVVIANLMPRGVAEKSGKLSIGDRLMSVNGTSLVGLPLGTCQNAIRDLKNQTEVTLSVVHCPPVTTAIVRRPDTKYPLGFCVENGIICSLMRGGIAERGGIRVGHRIIEINGQSVVAMSHEKIIQILTQAVSKVHIKTMPASTFRLLTGQEQPVFL